MMRSLNGKWTLISEDLQIEKEVNVPGSILNDLLINNIIDDPFYRDNEHKIKKYLDYDYQYSRSFEVSIDDIKQTIELVFLGIDTIAEINVNGHLLEKTFNMHRTYRFKINDYVKVGQNKLSVLIKSPFDFMNQQRNKSQYEFLQMSYAVKNYPYIRKAHSMFGWDWGPQLPDGGIWRDVYLEIYKYGRINDVEITQKTTTERSEINVEIENVLFDEVKMSLDIYEAERLIHHQDFVGEENNELSLVIENPKLWYPRGYGDQPLYHFIIKQFYRDLLIDQKEIRYGLRNVEIIRKKDEYGESFTFAINKIKVFLKGSNYIIEDNLLSRQNRNTTKYLIDAILMGNHNAIRVWGGGIFPPDYFYELCDEAGIIVWQDLLFACSYYDMNNKDFIEEITFEIIDNLKRIRNHPSLCLICGNNENEAAIEWGAPSKDISKEMYLYQYEDLIPKLVKKIIPSIFYWPSSPSSGGGFDNPNDDARGDMHYWGVWHNDEPIEYYRKYYPRLMSEFGIQSFPHLKTISTFTTPDDLNVFSYVMESHQKNATANEKIIKYISKMFKMPSSFVNTIYLSQIIQAEGVRYCVEHLRRNIPRCMGSLYWQLNDCWPGPSWSSIDYFGRFKALHYYSKKFYAPVLLSIEEDKNAQKANIYLSNDSLNPVAGRYMWSLIDCSGVVKAQGNNEFFVEAQTSKQLETLQFDLTNDETRKYLLVVDAIDNEKNEYQNHVAFVQDKHFQFERAELKYQLTINHNDCYLELCSNKVMKYVEIDYEDQDFIFSDNFFFLKPNQKKIISWQKGNQDIIQEKIKIRSLIDSY